MIDTVLRWLVPRYWRWRVARREQRHEQWTVDFMRWKREHPDRCMYCAYTLWANAVHGMKMKIDPHTCCEGNSPPHPLPKARTHS